MIRALRKPARNNKKAISEWDAIWIGVIVGIIAFFVSVIGGMKSMPNYVGEYQFSIINSAQKAENVLLYTHITAKYSSHQSIYSLAGSGGFYNNEKCGEYLGYAFWLTEGKKLDECFPDYRENFVAMLNENLNKHLRNYRGIAITDNYAVQLKDKSIIGIANSDVKIPISILSPEKKNLLTGAYSIKPSFNINANYDFDDYLELKEISGTIVQCLKDNDVSICLNIAKGIDDKFDWSLGCDKGVEKIIYDFAEFYQDCLDSEDTNCLCKKDLELSEEQISNFGLAGFEYELALKEDPLNKKIKIEVKKPEAGLTYNADTKDTGGWFPWKYLISYTKDGLHDLNMIFINQITGEDYEYKDIRGLGPTKGITIYKHEKEGRKYADFVKESGDGIEYPVPERNIKKPEGLHECKLKPKSAYRFCATAKNYKLTAYDASDNEIRERSLVYKFAVALPKAEATSGLE